MYDNAPSHAKRPVGAVSALNMTKGPKKDFTFKLADAQGVERMVRMDDGRFHDGTPQSFYFPPDHPKLAGWFEGMKVILIERGLGHLANKRYECLKCIPEATDWCCWRALSSEPDFETRDTIIEELARDRGSKQCWGYAKAKYRLNKESGTQAKLEENMLSAVYSVPQDTIRKFFARSRRFLDAYATGKNGAESVEWVNKKIKSHRVIPPEHITA
ncbi:hypothetical protein BDV93DRAFT_507395 [Ceratobasidium sp. AG-I]|nr:hypothetical protein BDV93DRAFT_507395 [Ceratobasidium sp. AG-I]